MPERGVSSQEFAKTPEKSLRGKVLPAAVWVASGVLAEQAGKRKIEGVDQAVSLLASQKPEDLSSHHAKVAAFSTKQREMHWQERQLADSRLASPDEQIMRWQDGVLDYLANLQEKGKYDTWHSALETLGVNQQEAEGIVDFSSLVRHKIEDFRQEFLQGPAKIDAFATYFTKGRSLEENLKALDNAEGFLGVFGGKETVQLVKDAIVAHAFVQDLQGERKDELLTAAKEAFDSELPEETARLYGLLYEKPQEMKKGEEHTLAVPLTESTQQMEPAPVEEEAQGGSDGIGEVQNKELEGLGSTPEAEEKVLTYPEFQKAVMDRELSRYPELAAWVKEFIDKLPEMTTTKAPLTNEKWKANMQEGGEVDKISGTFFTIEGSHITTPNFSWDQPGIWQSGTQIKVPTPEGMVNAKVSGFVGIISDKDGNILLTFGQEPYAESPKHALLRTPFQTSAQKFAELQAGHTEKDPGLIKLLDILYGEDSFVTFLGNVESGDIPVKILAPADANRIHATNLRMGIIVDDDQKRKALEMDGKNRWVSQEEFRALIEAGLVNGHTIAAGAFTAV